MENNKTMLEIFVEYKNLLESFLNGGVINIHTEIDEEIRTFLIVPFTTLKEIVSKEEISKNEIENIALCANLWWYAYEQSSYIRDLVGDVVIQVDKKRFMNLFDYFNIPTSRKLNFAFMSELSGKMEMELKRLYKIEL